MVIEAEQPHGKFLPEWVFPVMSELHLHHEPTYRHLIRSGFAAYIVWGQIQQELHHIDGASSITQKDMFLAGFLHDIEKRNIPIELLDKDKKISLTEGETTLLGEHPYKSADYVENYNMKVAAIIRGHHRWGGNGSHIKYHAYEDDSKAQAAMIKEGYGGIEIAQRILAIVDKADVFMNRVNKPHTVTIAEGKAELERRFEEELKDQSIKDQWLDVALQAAWDMGGYEL